MIDNHTSSKTEKRHEALKQLEHATEALIAATEGLPSMLREDGATPEQVQALFSILCVEIRTSKDQVEMNT